MTNALSPTAIEAVARALSASAGDDPDKLTYAYAMKCTGRDSGPQFHWQFWTAHATAAITAYLAQREKEGFVEAAKEPTPDMVRAAIEADDKRTGAETCKHIYRAMLAAAQNGSKDA